MCLVSAESTCGPQAAADLQHALRGTLEIPEWAKGAVEGSLLELNGNHEMKHNSHQLLKCFEQVLSATALNTVCTERLYFGSRNAYLSFGGY